jgi:hypothetical protein
MRPEDLISFHEAFDGTMRITPRMRRAQGMRGCTLRLNFA